MPNVGNTVKIVSARGSATEKAVKAYERRILNLALSILNKSVALKKMMYLRQSWKYLSLNK